MTARFLIDTNVLVYAYDRTAPAKQKQARQLLDWLARTGVGVLSSQVLAEFFAVITRKLTPKLDAAAAYQRLENLQQSWPVIEVTGAIVVEAARGVRDHQLSFWDAQIWATARLNQIGTVLSEDFSDGAITEGIRFLNPFAANFQVEVIVN